MCPYSTESADSAGPQFLKKDYISELIKKSDDKKEKINGKKMIFLTIMIITI